jgi:peptide/nickel transport system permease protein
MATLNQRLWDHGSVRFGCAVLLLVLLLSLAAPWLGTVDPAAMDASVINLPAGTSGTFNLPDGTAVQHRFWLGTDNFGRDVYSRVMYGGRISLVVGICTSLLALTLGGLCGMLAGYFRRVDAVLMRFMDGLMAIPAVLLAIALVAVLGASVATVVIAIAIPEVPRVTRLVRSLVLSLREDAIAPLLVQGTFVAASAVLTEAILSFLGLGLPADVPTWGNIMAEGRVQFSMQPGNVLFPALFLVPTVLAINLLGDGLRDVLDPKFAKRVG